MMIVSLLLLWIPCLWPWYSWDRQPATCRISTLINCRTGPFDTTLTTPPISPSPMMPDGRESPERNKKEGEMQKELTLLTQCWQKVKIVLFALTPELNQIMSVIIPVEGEELDPGQSGHAHLPGIHQAFTHPLEKEKVSFYPAWLLFPWLLWAYCLPIMDLQKKSCLALLLLPVCFAHWAAFSVSSDQEVFIGVTNKGDTGQNKHKGNQEGKERDSFQCLHSNGSAHIVLVQIGCKDQVTLLNAQISISLTCP